MRPGLTRLACLGSPDWNVYDAVRKMGRLAGYLYSASASRFFMGGVHKVTSYMSCRILSDILCYRIGPSRVL